MRTSGCLSVMPGEASHSKPPGASTEQFPPFSRTSECPLRAPGGTGSVPASAGSSRRERRRMRAGGTRRPVRARAHEALRLTADPVRRHRTPARMRLRKGGLLGSEVRSLRTRLTSFDGACPSCGGSHARPGDRPDGAHRSRDLGDGRDARSSAPVRSTRSAGRRGHARRDPAALDIMSDPLLGAIPLQKEGKILGGVRLVRRLGAGGMGAVYAGHHLVLETTVAVKILPVHLAGDESYEERFKREARLSFEIVHPNIVRTLHAGKEHGLFFLQMEFNRGLLGGRARPLEGAALGDPGGQDRARRDSRPRGGAPPRDRPPRREARQHPRPQGGRPREDRGPSASLASPRRRVPRP